VTRAKAEVGPPGAEHRDDLARIAALDDPVRRRLYEAVTGSEGPVGRDGAASAAGIGRSLAAYHLDKLVEQGLLTATYRRPEGRAGPGAGRPAKLYTRAEGEVSVSVPAREYELAARLLVEAAEEDRTGAARAALREVAVRAGREMAAGRAESPEAEANPLEVALLEIGYEPARADDGTLYARNCPFHRLAQEHRDVVCGMNVAFVEGLVEGLGQTGREVCLDPQPGRCCVTIRPGGD
jgi:predicted ArsR family transcriptional regulator